MATYQDPKQPLFLSPPVCMNCGKPIAHRITEYRRKRLKFTGNKITDLPYRQITNIQTLIGGTKTMEGNILDNMGIIRYCCRNTILTQPESMVLPSEIPYKVGQKFKYPGNEMKEEKKEEEKEVKTIVKNMVTSTLKKSKNETPLEKEKSVTLEAEVEAVTN